MIQQYLFFSSPEPPPVRVPLPGAVVDVPVVLPFALFQDLAGAQLLPVLTLAARRVHSQAGVRAKG